MVFTWEVLLLSTDNKQRYQMKILTANQIEGALEYLRCSSCSYKDCTLVVLVDGIPMWLHLRECVQCSAVQCSAVQCSAMQCSAVKGSAAQCSAVQCSAVLVKTPSVIVGPVQPLARSQQIHHSEMQYSSALQCTVKHCVVQYISV